MAGNLRIHPIQTALCSHQGGDADYPLIAKHADFHLRAILKSGCHGSHAFFDKKQVLNRLTGKFKLVFHFEDNPTQAESSNNLSIEGLQDGIPKYAIFHWKPHFA